MRLLPFILCLLMSEGYAQEARNAIDKDIDSAGDILFDVARCFHDSTQLPETSIDSLASALQRVNSADEDMIPKSIRGHPAWRRYQQDLTFAFFQFEISRSRSTSQDSIRNAFRELFYAFHNLCRPYLYQRTVPTAEARVLLFAASIACECTRKLCDEYAAGLARLRRQYGSRFDLIVIDSVVGPQMMDEYMVNTIPTAIGIDSRGNETGRLEGSNYASGGMEDLVRTMLGGRQ